MFGGDCCAWPGSADQHGQATSKCAGCRLAPPTRPQTLTVKCPDAQRSRSCKLAYKPPGTCSKQWAQTTRSRAPRTAAGVVPLASRVGAMTLGAACPSLLPINDLAFRMQAKPSPSQSQSR
jgi:hypothetical protein